MGVANIGAAATAMLILGGRYVGHLARTARNAEVVIHQARPIEWDHAYHRDLGKTKHEETRVQFQHQMSSDFVVMSTVKSSGFGSVLRLRVCSVGMLETFFIQQYVQTYRTKCPEQKHT